MKVSKTIYLFLQFFIFTIAAAGLTLFIRNNNLKSDCWWNLDQEIGRIKIYHQANCDSPEYVRLTIRFPFGFQENKTRMNRPLYPLMGIPIYFLTNQIVRFFSPSQLLTMPIENRMKGINHQEIWSGLTVSNILAGYISLIIVNLLLFTLSAFFIYQSLKDGNKSKISRLVILPLFALPIFREFIFVPHTVLFDIFLPVIFIYFYSLSEKKQLLTDEVKYLLSYILGILFLAKGLFLLIPVFLCLVMEKNNWLKKMVSLFWLLSPTLFYIWILKILGISYYNHEASEYRQGLWMIDSLGQEGIGQLAYQMIIKSAYLIKTTVKLYVWEILLIFILLFSNRKLDFSLKLPVCFFLFWTVFWIWVGYFETRNLFTLFPLILYIIGKQLQYKSLSNQRYFMLIFSLFIFFSNLYKW